MGDPVIDKETGQRLLDELGREGTGLPNRTLFTLVIGGLRVRLLRSTVTMASIVLAIAFLSYAGLTARLNTNLAQGVQTLEQNLDPHDPSPAAQERLAQLRQSLRDAGLSVQATLEGDTGNAWLITMALLTCAVGIANAMLMSVTERFREIGTMKCLGATDGLVVKLFLLESSMLGVIGAGLGLVLGLLVAIGAGLIQFGGYCIPYFPLWGGLVVLAAALGAGLILAVLGAVYPAQVAAKMDPVEALRVEE